MARVPNIRGTDSVPSGPLAWLKDWLESVRTWVRMRDPAEPSVGDPLDKFTTRGELIAWGAVTRNADGSFSGTGAGGSTTIILPPGVEGGGGDPYVPDLTPPPTPTGLVVSAGITNVYIELDAPTYTVGHGHAQTNIYGAIWAEGDTEPTFSDPRTKLIDNIVGPGTIHAYASNPATRWCIWIKFQSVDGVESTAPAGGTHGAQATTGQDVAALLEILTGQITASQLFTDLATPILSLQERLDDAASDALAAMLSVHEEQQSRAAALLDEARDRGTALTETRRVINEGDAQLAQSITTLTATVGGNQAAVLAALQVEQLTRASAIEAEAALRESLAAQVNDPATGLPATRATLLTDYSTTANMNAAIASSASSLTAAFSAADTTTLAAANAFTYSRAAIDGAISTSATSITAAYTAADASTLASANAFTYSRATIDGAIAASTATVNARLDSFAGTGSTVEVAYSAQASSLTGLAGQYTVKIDLNGYVSGFGLASTAVGATPFSQFIVRADSFSIASPSGPGITPIVPFIVRTTPGTVNGVSYPAGVYIDAAYILDLTAAVARLGNAWIDDAKVANLSAAKLTAGDGTIGGDLKSSAFTSGSVGWRIRPSGVAEFNNVTVRGAVFASSGTFAGSLVAATGTFAGSLSAATGTFSGSLSAASGTFTGALSGATGTYTGTLTVGTAARSGTTMTGLGFKADGADGTGCWGNATTNLTFDGTAMKMNGAWITAANLNLGSFTLTVDDSAVTASGPSPVDVSQAVTVTATGGTGPITYSWRMVQDGAIANGPVELYFSGNVFAASITVGARATNTGSQITGYAICTARDANGRTAEAAVFLSATCV
jgi:hypothetical protein